jgi:hypothetical protein
VILAVGLLVAVGSALFLYVFGLPLDASVGALVPFTTVCVGVILGPALVVMASKDVRVSTEITGLIIRLRTFGDDDGRRYYVAVDDGRSRLLRAFRVSASQYDGLHQGGRVTVRFTPNLGRVRWIIPAPDPAVFAG